MHGIVHKTLEAYVTDRTDADTWDTVLERAEIEPTLYLPVSTYDDREIDTILETVSGMATQDRPAIERDFGRTLAPELLSTFDAHVRDEWDAFDLLERLESVRDAVDAASDGTELPAVAGTRESPDCVVVTYHTQREQNYCDLAHGLLEGIVDSAAGDATVTKTGCVSDGDEACAFRVDRD